MSWLIQHKDMILTCVLVLSEAAAAIAQIAFPDNKGISGIMSGLIKFFQALGAKAPQAQ